MSILSSEMFYHIFPKAYRSQKKTSILPILNSHFHELNWEIKYCNDPNLTSWTLNKVWLHVVTWVKFPVIEDRNQSLFSRCKHCKVFTIADWSAWQQNSLVKEGCYNNMQTPRWSKNKWWRETFVVHGSLQRQNLGADIHSFSGGYVCRHRCIYMYIYTHPNTYVHRSILAILSSCSSFSPAAPCPSAHQERTQSIHLKSEEIRWAKPQPDFTPRERSSNQKHDM